MLYKPRNLNVKFKGYVWLDELTIFLDKPKPTYANHLKNRLKSQNRNFL